MGIDIPKVLLTDKKKRLLTLMCEGIQECESCSLYPNGRARPFWTEKFSGILLIGEAPGEQEVNYNTPFVGKAGVTLWEIINRRLGMNKDQFAVINTVNCRPMKGTKNGKPTPGQMDVCGDWVRKFVRILQPSCIVLLGGYAANQYLGLRSIGREVGAVRNTKLFDSDDTHYTVKVTYHPAAILYDSTKKERIERDIISLRNFI
jgi:DNA polymerase